MQNKKAIKVSQVYRKLLIFLASNLPNRHTDDVKGKAGPSFPSRLITTTLPNSLAIIHCSEKFMLQYKQNKHQFNLNKNYKPSS